MINKTIKKKKLGLEKMWGKENLHSQLVVLHTNAGILEIIVRVLKKLKINI